MTDEPKTKTIRIDKTLNDTLMKLGTDITHNPNCSANAALYAVIGELEKTRRAFAKLQKQVTALPMTDTPITTA
jgi:hypothetical protein